MWCHESFSSVSQGTDFSHQPAAATEDKHSITEHVLATDKSATDISFTYLLCLNAVTFCVVPNGAIMFVIINDATTMRLL